MGDRSQVRFTRRLSTPLRSRAWVRRSGAAHYQSGGAQVRQGARALCAHPQIGDKFASRGEGHDRHHVPDRRTCPSRARASAHIIVNLYAIPVATIGHFVECLPPRCRPSPATRATRRPHLSHRRRDLQAAAELWLPARLRDDVQRPHRRARRPPRPHLLPAPQAHGRRQDPFARKPMALLTRQPMEGRARDAVCASARWSEIA